MLEPGDLNLLPPYSQAFQVGELALNDYGGGVGGKPARHESRVSATWGTSGLPGFQGPPGFRQKWSPRLTLVEETSPSNDAGGDMYPAGRAVRHESWGMNKAWRQHGANLRYPRGILK